MRISRDARRRRPTSRERSRFAGAASAGGRNLIRFRRNREALWREVTAVILWAAIAFMLVDLAGTLNRFAAKHLADRPEILQWTFPALAVGAAAFCVLRARKGLLEILDIRREQQALESQLRSGQPEDDVPLA